MEKEVRCPHCPMMLKGNGIYNHCKLKHGIKYTKSKSAIQHNSMLNSDPESIMNSRLEQLKTFFVQGNMPINEYMLEESRIKQDYHNSRVDNRAELDVDKLMDADKDYMINYLSKLSNLSEIINLAARSCYGPLFLKITKGHVKFMSDGSMTYKDENKFYREDTLVTMYQTICKALSIMINNKMEEARINGYAIEFAAESDLRDQWDIPNTALYDIQMSIAQSKIPQILSAIRDAIAMG